MASENKPHPRGKTVAESETVQFQVVMPPHLNGYGKLFGGQLAVWIDTVAGIVARRHCGGKITTAAIDNLRFHEPVAQNEMLVLHGRMTHVGRTSMEVRVESRVEDSSGNRRLINTAFVIQVALDGNDRPTPVPPLILETDEEREAFARGEKRRRFRKLQNAYF
ncbi:MAG: acyl-CoA thioesterase [Planctomycetota bacterium]|jgi:acyl-CoA hydrolase|nr:acyl-CoA thioesterase [Planctomycetota bacterium]